MNGVKKMTVSSKVIEKNNLVIEYFNSLPDVKAEKNGELSGVISIENHPPLSTVNYRYKAKGRLWTKDYDLVYSVSLNSKFSNGEIQFKNNKFVAKCSDNDILNLVNELNNNSKLGDILRRNDIIYLRVRINGGIAEIELILMTFGITKMLIPPLTHMIKPVGKECIDAFQILQVLSFYFKM